MIRIPEYLERHRPDGVPELIVPGPARAAAARRRPSDRTVTAVVRPPDHPDRARFVQGLADLGRGGTRTGRRLDPRPPGRHDPALPARRRRRGHARGGRGGRRLGPGRRRPSPTRSVAADPGPLAPIGRRDARRHRDGRGVGAVAGRRGRARRGRRHLGRHRRPDPRGARRGCRLDRARDRRQRHDRRRRGPARGRSGRSPTATPARADLAGLDPRLGRVALSVACDVSNPLLGPFGAAAVYGPQKGATPADVADLDGRLAVFADALEAAAGHAASETCPGAGAAGGVGFALLAIGRPIRVVRPAARRRPRHGGDRLRRPPRRRRPRHDRRRPDRRPDRVRQDRTRCRPSSAGGGRPLHRGRRRRRARGDRGTGVRSGRWRSPSSSARSRSRTAMAAGAAPTRALRRADRAAGVSRRLKPSSRVLGSLCQPAQTSGRAICGAPWHHAATHGGARDRTKAPLPAGRPTRRLRIRPARQRGPQPGSSRSREREVVRTCQPGGFDGFRRMGGGASRRLCPLSRRAEVGAPEGRRWSSSRSSFRCSC